MTQRLTPPSARQRQAATSGVYPGSSSKARRCRQTRRKPAAMADPGPLPAPVPRFRPERAQGGTGSGTWGRGGTWRPVLPPPPPFPGMERRRTPADKGRYSASQNRRCRYRQRRFWEALYRQEGAEPREWLGGLSRYLPQLEPELRPGDRILVLGCGNSALSHDLHERGYPDVTSVDFSPACIAAMRARYARCPRLRWAVMDVRALAFPDAAFDVVLEKGTLDVFMAEETDPWHVSPRAAADMHRALAEVWGGGRGWTPSPFGADGGVERPVDTPLPWGCPRRRLCPPTPARATLRRGTWEAPSPFGGERPPLPPHRPLPRELDGAGCPPGGLGDPRP
uniref:EEF1A lysine methyltransferase 4 n=1 Tax=Calidris pygmaea TaxID=425635 RepID=A0A8C3KDI7_9CHAR